MTTGLPRRPGGEIDIMESRNNMTECLGTLHFGGLPIPQNWRYINNSTSTNFSAAFHVVAVEWEAKQIRVRQQQWRACQEPAAAVLPEAPLRVCHKPVLCSLALATLPPVPPTVVP